jgi:hypothetical protein
MTLITAEEEASVRLLVFGAALVLIATRERTLAVGRKPEQPDFSGRLRGPRFEVLQPPHIHHEFTTEARAIADAVVDEARRFETVNK